MIQAVLIRRDSLNMFVFQLVYSLLISLLLFDIWNVSNLSWYLLIKSWYFALLVYFIEFCTVYTLGSEVIKLWNSFNTGLAFIRYVANAGSLQCILLQRFINHSRENFVNVFSLFCNYFPLETGWTPINQGFFVQRLVGISTVVLEKQIIKFRQCTFVIS